MEKEKISQLKEELSLLLEKYNVNIVFTCGENSDTYGLYNDHISVREKSTNIDVISSDNWYLTANNLKEG